MRSIVSLSFVLATMSVATVASAAPVTEVPNPLTLYPRRPGAKFEDIEARPHVVVRVPLVDSDTSLDYDISLELWTRKPRTVVPAGWHYAEAGELEHANHADGFVAHPAPTGTVLHLVLRSDASTFRDLATVYCTLTDPSDGTEFLPFLPPKPNFSAPAPPATTVSSTAVPKTVDVDAYVAINGRHGPMYVRCGLDVILPVDAHVVWRINV